MAVRYFKLGVVYALLGMALGLMMAASKDHSQMPTHAHLNLLGYVTMFVFGFYYQLNPTKADSIFAKAQFWLANIGVIAISIGLYLLFSGNPEAEAIAIAGSFASFFAMLAFAVTIYKS